MSILLQVLDAQGNVRGERNGDTSASLLFREAYQEGDRVRIAADSHHIAISLDSAVGEAQVFLPTGEMYFAIPHGERRSMFAPGAFEGNGHLLYVRIASPEEIAGTRNLAHNPYDSNENVWFFPHASANVETRGEAAFAARNAIDGNIENHGHGEWPYTSWGIAGNSDAEIILSFGREVLITGMTIFLRADFPHDSYWRQARLTFSDGSVQIVPLCKTEQGQRVDVQPGKRAEWVRLDELIIDEKETSPFPSLSQWMIFGA